MKLSEKLSELCKREDVNQIGLAKKLGVSAAYISQVMGGREPSPTLVILVDTMLNAVRLPDGLLKWAEEEASRREMRSASAFVEYLVRKEKDLSLEEKVTPSISQDAVEASSQSAPEPDRTPRVAGRKRKSNGLSGK